MSRYFHGKKEKYPYFEGWYLKHQCRGRTAAFIPAVHVDQEGKWSASIQVILEKGAYHFPIPADQCHIEERQFCVRFGDNIFSEQGIKVNLKNKKMSISGEIRYTSLGRLNSDIMGPFRFLPFMQCSHGVLSMNHFLEGSLCIDGVKVDMTGGAGYIETDRGRSFPKSYAWTQCLFGEKGQNSIMLSVADIPMFGKSFTGCICEIWFRGRKYRMATYLGCRILVYEDGEIAVKQGRRLLRVIKLGEQSYGLLAPQKGSMTRIIRESPSCKVRYQFWDNGRQVFDKALHHASFEQVLPGAIYSTGNSRHSLLH